MRGRPWICCGRIRRPVRGRRFSAAPTSPWARTSRSKPIETARETRCVPPRSTSEKAAGREHPQAVAARALLAAQGRDQLTVCPRTYNCRFAINTSTSDRFATSCATQALSQSLRIRNSAASVHSKPQLEQLLHCGTLPFASAAAPRSRPRALSEVRRYGDAGQLRADRARKECSQAVHEQILELRSCPRRSVKPQQLADGLLMHEYRKRQE